MTDIHSTAIIAKGAELDTGVKVGPYCVIGENVKIGRNTIVHSHVVIEGRTTLGEENEIFPFACLGTSPQDLKFSNEPSTLVIGDKNKIRESVTIQPGTKDGHMTTKVGSRNLFMANCHVGHDCVVGNDNVFANSVALAGHVGIGDFVILGGMAGIHQFSRVGTLAFVGAGAMVSLDVPPYCIAQGDRAVIRGLNLIGLRRAGISGENLVAVKKTYKHFFSTIGHLKEKLESFPDELKSSPNAKLVSDFIQSSKRGLISSSRHSASSKNSDDSAE